MISVLRMSTLVQNLRSDNLKLVIAFLATTLVFTVAIFGVIRPLLAMNRKLKGMIADINTVSDEMKENKAVAETLHAETERFI